MNILQKIVSSIKYTISIKEEINELFKAIRDNSIIFSNKQISELMSGKIEKDSRRKMKKLEI